MSGLDQALMICPHVRQSIGNTGFICNTQDGCVAACSEECSSLESEDGLSFIHVGHLIELVGLPEQALCLPVNTCVRVEAGRWYFDYFVDDTDAQEGEFRLADPHVC